MTRKSTPYYVSFQSQAFSNAPTNKNQLPNNEKTQSQGDRLKLSIIRRHQKATSLRNENSWNVYNVTNGFRFVKSYTSWGTFQRELATHNMSVVPIKGNQRQKADSKHSSWWERINLSAREPIELKHIDKQGVPTREVTITVTGEVSESRSRL